MTESTTIKNNMSQHKIPVTPVGNKLIVHPLPKQEEELASGIIVSAAANAELLEGEIVAVSPQIKDLYQVGQIVLYPNRKGVGQIFNGKPYLWLDAETNLQEIWGIKTS